MTYRCKVVKEGEEDQPEINQSQESGIEQGTNEEPQQEYDDFDMESGR